MLEEMKNEMPTGYTAKPLTWTWDWNKVKRQYSLLLLLLVAIYMICAILFESLKQSFVILATIPVSFIGLFLTFGWLEFYFDQGGYAAFILLGGLTVNATIFIINDFNAMRGKNKSKNRNRNIVKASYAKAIPILLTVLSTCAGLIPFLIGGQNEVFWFTLAAGTIGGLVVSLFGVFVLCPVLLAEK
jgi:multidrug efflux pump subunit AcrB